MEERDEWNAFKKKARIKNPIGSKIDHRYYERLRAEYKAQRDSTQNLEPRSPNCEELVFHGNSRHDRFTSGHDSSRDGTHV